MHQILFSVLAVAVLLILVSIAVPLSDRLRVPHTVLLAALGMAIGFATIALPGGGDIAIAGDILRGFGDLGVGANVFLALFLPPLLFVAGLGIDVRRLIDEFAAVLLLAVVAVIVCTGVVGVALSAVSDVGLIACLLLGSIIATTDPAAVVAIFRDLGAPRRLSILVQGESLYNDAAAIVLFTILLAFLTGDGTLGVSDAVVRFLVGFAGGIAVGYAMARGICELLPLLKGSLVAEITVTVALAYLTFVVGEAYFHVSGIVAVATASLTVAAYGPLRMAPSSWRSLIGTWDQLEFWASSLIFVLATMLAARVITEATLADLGMILVLIVAAFVARAIVLYGLLPGLAAARLTAPVDHRYKAVILWGGLRGAVTMVLALAISENYAVPEAVRHFAATLAIGFVLFTLFVNAPTLGSLLGLLGLNRLDPVELALRNRVMALSRSSIREQINEVAQQYGLDPALAARVAPPEPPPETGPTETELAADVRLQVGLLTLVARARQLYLLHFDQHTISRRLMTLLVVSTDRLVDRVKTDGVAGYRRATETATDFGRSMRLALWLHRRWGWSGPLSHQLADRFETLLIQQRVVRELVEFNRRSVRPVLGELTSAALADLIAERLQALQHALAALELQYPSYAQALGAQHLLQATLRLEDADYRQKLAESLISREVFNDLQADLRARRHALGQRPSLDLGLKLTEMMRRVPMFANLDQPRMNAVGRLLKPMLVTPGERIVVKGEHGDTMYFIAAGDLEVKLDHGSVPLSAGDFFGELALLHNRPRSADVVALGFCHLLALDAADWRRLLRTNPDLKTEIEKIAGQRLAHNVGERAAE